MLDEMASLCLSENIREKTVRTSSLVQKTPGVEFRPCDVIDVQMAHNLKSTPANNLGFLSL